MDDPETGLCGAKTRDGSPCKRFPAQGKRRCRLHGGAEGSGAPFGERNGNWRGGRYSRTATREQRREAWRAYWAEKRAARADTGGIPYIGDDLQSFWPESRGG